MSKLKVSAGDLHHAYREVFGTQAGQIVMADLVRCFGFTERTLIGPDPHTTYANEGRRSVLLHVQRRLTEDPQDEDLSTPQYGDVHPSVTNEDHDGFSD